VLRLGRRLYESSLMLVVKDWTDIRWLIWLIGLQSIDIVAYLIQQVFGLTDPTPMSPIIILARFQIFLKEPALRLVQHLRCRLLQLTYACPHQWVVLWLLYETAAILGVVNGRDRLSLVLVILLLFLVSIPASLLGHRLLEHLILLAYIILLLLSRRILHAIPLLPNTRRCYILSCGMLMRTATVNTIVVSNLRCRWRFNLLLLLWTGL
jgi:hypothetical protein